MSSKPAGTRFIGDLSAGLTLLAIAIPEQLATSRLAGATPISGYYAFIAAALVFALFGAGRWLSVGADSTIAPMIAAGLAPLALAGSHRYAQLAAILAVSIGVLVLLAWALRLGWMAEFLSAPIITGFLAGVASVIVVHQLPDLFGLPPGTGSNVHRLVSALTRLSRAHALDIVIGLGVLALVLILERVSARLPAVLIAMSAATLSVPLAGLRGHGVALLGHISRAAPSLGLSGLS
ncbi:MAG: SulP family inorganic anion transporter, partial [Solirubrobacterales bacterium]|nr:SulP family inorganic anion transporter [Solirubrobacterales bacterium]